MTKVMMTQTEADVYLLIIAGMKPKEIAAELERKKVSVESTIGYLIKKGYIRRIGSGKYESSIKGYVIKKNPDTLPMKINIPKDWSIPDIDDETAYYLKSMLGKIPRSEIARRLKVSKATLMKMILSIEAVEG